MLTLKEILKDKTYPFIEHRTICKNTKGKTIDKLTGYFSYENKKLKSYTMNTYHMDDEFDNIKEFVLSSPMTIKDKTIPAGTICLTVWDNMDDNV